MTSLRLALSGHFAGRQKTYKWAGAETEQQFPLSISLRVSTDPRYKTVDRRCERHLYIVITPTCDKVQTARHTSLTLTSFVPSLVSHFSGPTTKEKTMAIDLITAIKRWKRSIFQTNLLCLFHCTLVSVPCR